MQKFWFFLIYYLLCCLICLIRLISFMWSKRKQLKICFFSLLFNFQKLNHPFFHKITSFFEMSLKIVLQILSPFSLKYQSSKSLKIFVLNFCCCLFFQKNLSVKLLQSYFCRRKKWIQKRHLFFVAFGDSQLLKMIQREKQDTKKKISFQWNKISDF